MQRSVPHAARRRHDGARAGDTDDHRIVRCRTMRHFGAYPPAVRSWTVTQLRCLRAPYAVNDAVRLPRTARYPLCGKCLSILRRLF
jgi:hypothetical protein